MILTTPPETPVTRPVVEPTIATVAREDDHVPPLVPSVSATDDPAQTMVAPEIGVGAVLTDMVFTAAQPSPNE